MTLLCWCGFQLPEWLRDSDLIGAAFGSLLGFAFAWVLLQIQFRQEKRKENQLRIDELNSYQRHCRDLLRTALQGWHRTRQRFLTLGKAYTDEPTKDHPHPITANVAQRSIDRMDRVRLREAFAQTHGERLGFAMSARLNSLIDYYGHFLPIYEAAIIAIKQDIEDAKKQFDRHQFELCLTIQNQIAQLARDGRRNESYTRSLMEILDQVDYSARTVGSLASPDYIQTHLIRKVLNLVGKGYSSFDLAPVLTSAMRADKDFQRISIKAYELQKFVTKQAENMRKKTVKAERLLHHLDSSSSANGSTQPISAK